MLKFQYFGHLLRRATDAGEDWGQGEKGMTEDEMVGWHHRLDGYEFEQALGVGDGQGSLARCSPWGRKELDTTEQLNWTEIYLESTIAQNSSKWEAAELRESHNKSQTDQLQIQALLS